jgi:hypothetical protein
VPKFQTYARLYWGAYQPAGGSVDTTALIERPGTAFTQPVTADPRWAALVPGWNGEFWYQGSADISELLVAAGPGTFRVSGVSSVANLNTLNCNVVIAGWAAVAFYQRGADPPRNLANFDGLDAVGLNQPQTAVHCDRVTFLNTPIRRRTLATMPPCTRY